MRSASLERCRSRGFPGGNAGADLKVKPLQAPEYFTCDCGRVRSMIFKVGLYPS